GEEVPDVVGGGRAGVVVRYPPGNRAHPGGLRAGRDPGAQGTAWLRVRTTAAASRTGLTAQTAPRITVDTVCSTAGADPAPRPSEPAASATTRAAAVSAEGLSPATETHARTG